jgi:hypothetical protein
MPAVYEHLHEGITVLAARTPKLESALLAAKMALRLGVRRARAGKQMRRRSNDPLVIVLRI